LTPAPHDGPVVLDLQAAQSATYRERGVARYVVDYAAALVRTDPEILDQILVRPDLRPIDGLEPAVARLTTDTPDWDRSGGVFHALSPFDLDTPVRDIWPREASQAGMRLAVTVYDLIPELFPDIYLTDPGLRHRYRARRELVRAADLVMTLSQSAADDVADHLGVPDHRITVVGAACSEVFRPVDRSEPPGHDHPPPIPGLGQRFVVYNGAVEPRKNLEGLLRAFARVPATAREGCQLVLVCRLEPLERHHYEVLGRQLGLDGALLLTGQVSDAVLVHLYQHAELVVYPSLYEGYGLPVAEAMACGAPVLASNNSSLVELVAAEATFDPYDLDDMARAIERGLMDQAYRERLLRWSVRPRPTWTEVAERAAQAYRRVAFDGNHRARRPAAWRRRPLLALITPWPPATTGVASYSQRLARALAATAEVELFIDGDPIDRSDSEAEFSSYPAWALPYVSASRGGYDAVVACVGNSEHHASALKLLRLDRWPAAVLAHDVRLTGLYRHSAARGAVPEGYAAALASMYPESTPEWMSDGWVGPDQAEAHGVYMAKELIGLGRPFIVTSEFAAELARDDARPGDGDRIRVCPYAYPAPVVRDGSGVVPGLICTFGLVNLVKQPQLLLEAFALVHRADPDSRLVFVGPVDPALHESLHAEANRLGVGGSVTFAGEADDDAYDGWLARTSVAVQLRAGTNGETSGAVADCLSHGIATIVTDIGPARSLPAFVTKVPVDASPSDLAEAITGLLRDDRRRASAGQAGLAFVEQTGFEQGARDLLATVLVAPDRRLRPALS
jgi:glycosyltransferase involved in cell wall biosynthesis